MTFTACVKNPSVPPSRCSRYTFIRRRLTPRDRRSDLERRYAALCFTKTNTRATGLARTRGSDAVGLRIRRSDTSPFVASRYYRHGSVNKSETNKTHRDGAGLKKKYGFHTNKLCKGAKASRFVVCGRGLTSDEKCTRLHDRLRAG